MDTLIIKTGECTITITDTSPEAKPGHRHKHHHGERSKKRNTHNGTSSREYDPGQGHPLTLENLAAHEEGQKSKFIPQLNPQEDDTTAQIGNRYPEEHERHRRRFHNTPRVHAYLQEPRTEIPGPSRRAHGVRERSRTTPRPGVEYVRPGVEHVRPGVEYVAGYGHQSNQYDGRSHGTEYQQERDYHAALHQQDRLDMGQQRPRTNRSRMQESSLSGGQSGTSSEDKPQDPLEWALCRRDTEGQLEMSDDGSSECEV
ncbi:hypothetical protein L873DRAFT_1809183, partial [Choiromyces venosus 120613-1]